MDSAITRDHLKTMPSRLDELANEILEHAATAGLTLATAESCTAGRLATTLAKGKGSAQHFRGGFVTYMKEAKIHLLGVPPDMLAHETAVSANVAQAMAWGAVTRARASLAVAITGVTGSEPDDDGNPVGLVFCGVARAAGGTQFRRLELGNAEPEELVDDACVGALTLLRDFAFS